MYRKQRYSKAALKLQHLELCPSPAPPPPYPSCSVCSGTADSDEEDKSAKYAPIYFFRVICVCDFIY